MRRRKPARPKLLSSVPKAWSSDLRRESRTKLLRWGLHGVLLSILLGVPYARGRLRAAETQEMHAKAAACLYGGTSSQLRGGTIDDPSGHFAAMFLHRNRDWPSRCEAPLRELAREPARFVFPSVKEAEADVQKAAQIILEEIDGLPETASPGGKVPLRPLWGLEMLRTAVVAHSDAAGEPASAEAATKATSVPQRVAPTPTLLDIDAALDATIKLWGEQSDLQLAAFDARGVSYMRLQSEHTTRARLPRVGSLRSAVRQGRDAYLVWTTAADKCGPSRCAEKSMGLAPMPVPLTKLPEPRWVAAHPFGSPERSLAWQGARLWLAAAHIDGTAQLIEFDYRPLAAADVKEKEPPLQAAAHKLRGARDLVVFTDRAGVLGALALEVGADRRWSLIQHRDGQAPQPLLTLPESWDSAWVRTCAANDTRYFLVGGETEAQFGYVRDGAATLWPAFPSSIPGPPRTDRDPTVAVTCTDTDGITAAFVADGSLKTVTCARDRTACTSHILSELATSVDATYARDGVLVAYSGAPEQPQVRLTRIDRRGVPGEHSIVPGPCWERWGGMCGEPTLAWAGERLVLGARSGPSLMALESSDAGRTWSELRSTNLVQPPGPHVLPRVAAR